MRAAFAAAVLSLAAANAVAGDPVLTLPIDCTPDETCFVQHLVDLDPGPAARDFRCGTLTYDGHKGTDFALPTRIDLARGVAVLAAAPGVVAATRDGMQDRIYDPAQTPADDVEGRECGNGVLIRHEDGWETQYCHLRRGSVAVQTGDRVGRGDRLGLVGLSGKTQFPHLHLSVRQDGRVVDPYAPAATAPACGTNPATETLWQDPPPAPPGGVMYAAFSDQVPDYTTVKAGTAGRSLTASAPAIVMFALAYGSQAGDILRFDIKGPDGQFLNHEAKLDKAQAQFFRAAGRRLTMPRWPAGTYAGKATLLRDGVALGSATASVDIR
ncbi:MAG: M23 family metallopeptidase [Marinibacterium sp.]